MSQSMRELTARLILLMGSSFSSLMPLAPSPILLMPHGERCGYLAMRRGGTDVSHLLAGNSIAGPLKK
jgi:hypothetical protein